LNRRLQRGGSIGAAVLTPAPEKPPVMTLERSATTHAFAFVLLMRVMSELRPKPKISPLYAVMPKVRPNEAAGSLEQRNLVSGSGF
jgi:hypothetical protein